MVELVLFIALVGLAAIVWRLQARVAALESRLHWTEAADRAAPPSAPDLRDVPVAAPAPAARSLRAPARVVGPSASPSAEPPVAAIPADADENGAHAPHPEAHEPATVDPLASEPLPPDRDAPAGSRWEEWVGARLPIWIGGAALVLAAFFFVRYSLEIGLLGPAARTVLAALFGVALLAAAEVARRWRAMADDPRIGQALAGAGIASLYGTLYMASELYGLIGLGAAIALLLTVTVLALALSWRHGPPTAIMGLIGGFAAPLVTGYGVDDLIPLLLYLALFTAGLFILALARGWLWLALAAALGGFGWSLWLLGSIEGPAVSATGPFILALALGAALSMPARVASGVPIRVAPLALGLFQLVILGARMEFRPLGWGLYALLMAATLALGARDARLRPAVWIGGGLVLAMLAIALATDAPTGGAAAIGFAILLGGAGAALALRQPGVLGWPWLALAGSAAPVLLARGLQPGWLSEAGWTGLLLATAMATGWTAWRLRVPDDGHRWAALAAPLTTALLAGLGLGGLLPATGWPLLITGLAALLALWAMRLRDPAAPLMPALAWAAVPLAAHAPLWSYATLVTGSLVGVRLTWPSLPDGFDTLWQVALPAVGALLIAWRVRAAFGFARPAVLAAAGCLLALAFYHLLKLPLAIDTRARFVTWGFTERAAITQVAFAVAFVAARLGWRGLAWTAIAIALGRVLWFDALLLNPLWLAQSVGPLPVLNAAVIHFAALAGWLWALRTVLPHPKLWRRLAFAATLATVLIAIRQLTHGDDLTGPAGEGETWLYSAGMLALAIGWLLRGVRTGAGDLRAAGLALVTLVTLKVFLIDAAALGGVLRILSLLGLGFALIGIGWLYRRVFRPAG